MIAYINQLEEIKFKNKIFNIIEKENLNNREIFSLPINNNVKKRKIELVAIKLCKTLYKENISNIVLSNGLITNEILKEKLKGYKMNILDGNKLYKILLPKIIKKICDYKNSGLEEERVSILTNDSSEINLTNILDISQKAKTVNIITSNPNKFSKIANYLYEELGILIRISNNIKSDLLNSNIIINTDFTEDLINKYNINTKAIIINIPQNIKINSKKFAGIIINSYNIIIPEEYKLKNFDNKFIYESIIYYKNITETMERVNKDNIKVDNLIGKNGIINKKEFLAI